MGLRRGSRRIGASIEAKFGHSLTKGQLPNALAHVRDVCGWSIFDSTLIVVAPDDLTEMKLMQANRRFGWRCTTWWIPLQRVEQLTAAEHDDDEYRRFRRTIWHRVYRRTR